MYAFIEGSIDEITPTEVVLNNQGIGYLIQISLFTYEVIHTKKEIRLLIQPIIREDAHTLYGFINKEEKQLFTQLISVSGVGPNTARVMLSSLSAGALASCIADGDVATLKSVKGIGAKTAQRIVVDLKDKVDAISVDSKKLSDSGNRNSNDALSALIALGFSKSIAQKAIQKLDSELLEGEVETIIKGALKYL